MMPCVRGPRCSGVKRPGQHDAGIASRFVLFFIDETWQEIGGEQVAALGAVAIKQGSYNAFCREVFAIKKNVLGATELGDSELKGAKCFAKRTFRRREEKGSRPAVASRPGPSTAMTRRQSSSRSGRW